jgi:outer membrane protein assembly factor BamD
MTRIVGLALIWLILLSWTARAETGPPDIRRTIAPVEAAKEMEIGRYYVGKGDHTAGLNRFKVVVMKFRESPQAEEALARLTDVYVALSIPSEAQTAAAVLARKFPDGPWAQVARDALSAAGLEPAEDERSWISRAFK